MWGRDPQEDRDPKDAWKEAVANDDTEMGFDEWCEWCEEQAEDYKLQAAIDNAEARMDARREDCARREWAGCDGPGGY